MTPTLPDTVKVELKKTDNSRFPFEQQLNTCCDSCKRFSNVFWQMRTDRKIFLFCEFCLNKLGAKP